MGFLMYVFSGFWPWLGLVILIMVTGDAVAEVVKAVRKFQKIDAYCLNGEWTVHIDGARRGDLSEILGAPMRPEKNTALRRTSQIDRVIDSTGGICYAYNRAANTVRKTESH